MDLLRSLLFFKPIRPGDSRQSNLNHLQPLTLASLNPRHTMVPPRIKAEPQANSQPLMPVNAGGARSPPAADTVNVMYQPYQLNPFDQQPTLNDPNPVPNHPIVPHLPSLQIKNELGVPIAKRETAVKSDPNTLSDFVKSEEGLGANGEDYEVLNFQLHRLLAGASADDYKKAVDLGVEALSEIRSRLENAPEAAKATGDVTRWIKQIEDVQKLSKEAKTIIGVVGNTGCGKSSLINALLDEERLIPTSTVRACTAVVTEISYNLKYAEFKYSAEVEFITEEEWAKELKVLYDDLLSGGEVSRESSNTDSEAGVAWHKIKSVYPQKTKEMLAKTNIEQLLMEPSVNKVLGTTKVVRENYVNTFYDRLQFFIDSKDKRTRERKRAAKERGEEVQKSKAKKPPREMEYWPLIRVVKIFIKAPVLDTGAIIVDLPGVHDSNEARANVAKNYMKNCSGLWIVAPIIRAVDDKAAKDLLGEQFKRQLQMDGGYSQVTFICSKTDDISITEAIHSLPEVSDQLEEKVKQQDEIHGKVAAKRREVKRLGGELQDLDSARDTVEDTIDTWKELQEKAEGGKKVYAPTEKKRRSSGRQGKKERSKRRRRSDDSDYDSESASEPEVIEVDSGNEKEPLTLEEINKKLDELDEQKGEYRKMHRAKREERKAAKEALEKLENDHARLEEEIAITCIERRSIYSREAIRQDFAQGLEELEREAAEEEDAENYNPEDNVRDYEEVSRNLPVFCVSSRGYQKLQGRLRKDADLPFTDVDQTEVPQLKKHCRAITDDTRVYGWVQFLTQLSRFLNTLGFCAAPMGNRSFLDPESGKKAIEAAFLKLAKSGEKAVSDLEKSLDIELDDSIFDRYEKGVDEGAKYAVSTSDRWGSKVNRENFDLGGYYWPTYKALCRRDGVFTGARGFQDMNEQLLRPMLAYVTKNWDSCFSRRIPAKLAKCAKNIKKAIQDLHENAINREIKLGGNAGRLRMFDVQISIYQDNIGQTGENIKAMIQDKQRYVHKQLEVSLGVVTAEISDDGAGGGGNSDVNRMFHPKIQDNMHDAYKPCVNEYGGGQFMRMKDIMHRHVSSNRRKMFNDAAETVQASLGGLVFDAVGEFRNQIGNIFRSLKTDYLTLVGSSSAQMNEGVLKALDPVLEEIREVLEDVYAGFEDEFGEKKVEEENGGSGEKSPVVRDSEEDSNWSDGGN